VCFQAALPSSNLSISSPPPPPFPVVVVARGGRFLLRSQFRSHALPFTVFPSTSPSGVLSPLCRCFLLPRGDGKLINLHHKDLTASRVQLSPPLISPPRAGFIKFDRPPPIVLLSPSPGCEGDIKASSLPPVNSQIGVRALFPAAAHPFTVRWPEHSPFSNSFVVLSVVREDPFPRHLESPEHEPSPSIPVQAISPSPVSQFLCNPQTFLEGRHDPIALSPSEFASGFSSPIPILLLGGAPRGFPYTSSGPFSPAILPSCVPSSFPRGERRPYPPFRFPSSWWETLRCSDYPLPFPILYSSLPLGLVVDYLHRWLFFHLLATT